MTLLSAAVALSLALGPGTGEQDLRVDTLRFGRFGEELS